MSKAPSQPPSPGDVPIDSHADGPCPARPTGAVEETLFERADRHAGEPVRVQGTAPRRPVADDDGLGRRAPRADTEVGTVDISYNTTIGYWHAPLYLREDG